MLIVMFRAIFLYALIMFSLRLMGKRQLGELQPSELVITILISNIASLPIEDSDIPMILGIIPVLVLVAFEIFVSNINLKSRGFRTMISGKPIVVIHDGNIDQKQLHKLRFSIDDLMESLRQNGIFDIKDVQYAVVETNGKVSVLQKFEAQTITPKMMKLTGENQNPPSVVISDGQIIKPALSYCKITEEWILSILRKKHKTLKNVFLMTADKDKNYFIVDKELKKESEK